MQFFPLPKAVTVLLHHQLGPSKSSLLNRTHKHFHHYFVDLNPNIYSCQDKLTSLVSINSKPQ